MDADKLSAIIVRHELAARKLDAGEADKIVRLLNAAIQDATKDLAARNALAASKGKDGGPARTKLLQDQIDSYTAINREVYGKIGERLETGLIDRAAHEADFATKAAKSAGATISRDYRPPDTNYLKRLVNNTTVPIDQHGAALLKPWVQGMADGDLRRFEAALRTGMALNETTDQLVARIEAGGWTKSRQSAQTVALTANSSIANAARLDSFKTMKGIRYVEWSSILDTRTSPICQIRSGTIYAIDEPHPVPPAHPRCRSTLLPRKDNTSPPLHKPYSEWLKGQSADVQDEVLGKARGAAFRKGTVTDKDLYRDDSTSFRTLDDLKLSDAKIVAPEPAPEPEAPKPFSPIDRSITAETIRVLPRKQVAKSLDVDFARAAADSRYDPYPEYRGIKPGMLGKATVGSTLSDEATSMIAALMKEADTIADAFDVPRLRGLKLGTGHIAAMGDGVLSVNPVYFNGYAAQLGQPAGEGLASALVKQRDALVVDLKASADELRATRNRIARLTGLEREKVMHEYLDSVDQYNAKRKEYLRIEKLVQKARRTDAAGAATEAKTWKPGDDVNQRPRVASDYFETPLERARATIYHEMFHHVHQTRAKVGRRALNKPPVERKLERMFFDKFHGRGPNGAKGLDLKKLVATSYATSDAFEWACENFALYCMGRMDLVEDELRELFERLLQEVKR